MTKVLKVFSSKMKITISISVGDHNSFIQETEFSTLPQNINLNRALTGPV